MSGCVLITGSGRRIGRALALRFAGRGWRVALHYGHAEERARQTLEEVRGLGGDAMLLQADVRDREQVRSMVKKAHAHFGAIDVLVNNAGIYPRPVPVADVTEELWRSVIETNLYGEFFTAQAVAERMLEDGTAGRIVNLSSLGAFQIWKNRIPYNVSKAAVVQLTRALARALAPTITVNSVAPGAIELPDDPSPGMLLPADRIPMRRYGSADDIFRAVWFFAVDAGYITGQTLIVDGGLNIAQETSQE